MTVHDLSCCVGREACLLTQMQKLRALKDKDWGIAGPEKRNRHFRAESNLPPPPPRSGPPQQTSDAHKDSKAHAN
jgi:hypothetical protein